MIDALFLVLLLLVIFSIGFMADRISGHFNQEQIIGAAIKLCTGVICFVYQPNRHHHIVNNLAAYEKIQGMKLTPIGGNTGDIQGFITSHGRFVDRQEGYKIAVAAKQTDIKTIVKGRLFSEDVW